MAITVEKFGSYSIQLDGDPAAAHLFDAVHVPIEGLRLF
ncbi:hypothetical protein ACVW17_005518 [Bradyrhizobium sp. USDA 4473]